MPDCHGMVLVVDDAREWIEAISDFLEEDGYSVVAVPDGAAALETLSRMQPFAVVTDIQMPVMDGRQLLVRVHDRDAHVPVIVVTAEHIQDHDATLEGAFRVIQKPVPVEDLLTALVAAKAHRAGHLPLQKLWRAAGAVSRTHGRRVSRPRWERLRRLGSSVLSSATAGRAIMLTLALVSSVVLFKLCRGKLA